VVTNLLNLLLLNLVALPHYSNWCMLRCAGGPAGGLGLLPAGQCLHSCSSKQSILQ